MSGIDLIVEEKGRGSKKWDLTSATYEKEGIELDLNTIKGTLIYVAKTALKEEIAKGFDKQHITIVDNSPYKKEEQVKPFGKIEYLARINLRDAILFAFESVLMRSKVLTGKYKTSHVVTYNGYEVARSYGELLRWVDTVSFSSKDRIRIINIQPYARKLERYGITADGSTQRKRKAGKGTPSELVGMLIPNGAYVLSARATDRKYGKFAYIGFTFVDGAEAGLTNSVYKKDSSSKHFRAGNRKRTLKNGSRVGKPYFYPSILIKVVGSAIK